MLSVSIPKSNIVGVECKHVAYQEATDYSGDDLLLVKEVVHTKDGQQIPRIRLIENYKRPVFITKKNHRNHNDKKEYEHRDKLDMYMTTQAQMSVTIQRALGRQVPNPNLQLRNVCSNPYVYFADMSPIPLIKSRYRKNAPDLVSNSRVAILDIETDVVEGTDEPIMIAITMGEKKVIGLPKWWADRIPDIEETLTRKYKQHLSSIQIKGRDGKMVEHDLVKERGGDIEVIVCENMGLACYEVIQRAHQWMPDFLAIWNINFDLPRILAICKKHGITAEAVWTDPMVPEKYSKTRYVEAELIRETNSKTISQHPADLWHVLNTMAGFYVIDAMCVFKKIRVAKGNEPDYKLDGVLRRNLGIGKLGFDKVKAPEGGLDWHVEMQRDYPAEYCIYNLFDCISIELLDEKTSDLSQAVPVLIGISDMRIFPSLPKRLVDNLAFYYLERNLIAGTCGAVTDNELDETVVALSGWIVTLPAYMVEDNGLQIVKEVPKLNTMFRVQTADDDIEQAYPCAELILNNSKETTAIELKQIEGVSDAARRRAGINLTGGKNNAIEIANDLLNLPYIHDVLDALVEDMKEGLV